LDADFFIALINPGMALIFAATFALLWHNQRQCTYIAVLALSFAGIAAGFLLQYFEPLGPTGSKLVANVLFLACAIGLSAGALGRYGKTFPRTAILAFGGGGLAAFFWFFVIEPQMTWRIYAINFALGALALSLAAEIRAVPRRKVIDNILLGLMLVWGVSFFPRPILVMWIEGPIHTLTDFNNSLYWTTVIVSASLFLLLFALVMVMAIALDAMDELRQRSQTDSLSGLLNRRGFEEMMGAALGVPNRSAPATLVVCDIDHFKSVNDRFGHAGGDRVIERFAQCLQAAAEGQHLAGRIGGEEFALLLENADDTTARLFAEGVRIAFSNVAVPGIPAGTRITASFGVAEAAPGETVQSLFRRADKALYEAKNMGRDCVRVAPAAPPAQPGVAAPERLAAAV
jgi:diguanylate cyclase (GGDEF)-like protein